eukprot:3291657-Amphidinium_carterae.1
MILVKSWFGHVAFLVGMVYDLCELSQQCRWAVLHVLMAKFACACVCQDGFATRDALLHINPMVGVRLSQYAPLLHICSIGEENRALSLALAYYPEAKHHI